MRTIWLAKDSVQQGPMTVSQAQALIDAGQYQPHHMAWVVGTQVWRTIAEIPELSAGFRPPGTPLGADDSSAAAPPPPPLGPAGRLEGRLRPHAQAPRPWRRYAARTLDLACIDCLLQRLLSGYLPFGGLGSSLIMGPAAVVVLALVEAFCLQRYQSTLGKYFFGIVVRSQTGASLSQAQSMDRSLRAAFFGSAVGLPIVGHLANLIAYLDIRRPESASWDRISRSVVFYEDGTILRQIVGSMLIGYFELASMYHWLVSIF